MFTAQDPQTIRDAFAAAKPNAEYASLYAAAVARQQADQIYNLSLTRTATVTLGRGGARGDRRRPGEDADPRHRLPARAGDPRTSCPQAYFEVVATAQAAGRPASGCGTRPKEQDPGARSDAEAIAARGGGLRGPARRQGRGEAAGAAAAA